MELLRFPEIIFAESMAVWGKVLAMAFGDVVPFIIP